MKLSYAGCAILAPALIFAAALAMPEPTQQFAVAADNWSPAPTAAPRFNLFGREALQTNEGNTCGYVSGLSGTYLEPYHPSSTNFFSVLDNLPKFANMRNKYFLRRARVLRLRFPDRLHHRNNLHSI